MSCPRRLFLTQRKSVFRDVRMHFCLALRFLVTLRPSLHAILLFFQTSDRGRPACGRQTSAKTKTSARLKIAFVDMTYPKGWTGSLPLCPLIFSWLRTMGDKSVETLDSKIRFLSVWVPFSSLCPQSNVDFSISSTAQTTAPTQH